MKMPLIRDKDLYLEPMGYSPIDIDEINNFHHKAKSSPVSDYVNLKRVVDYLSSTRAAQETASNYKKYFTAKSIALPDAMESRESYESVVSNRRSRRNFSAIEFSLQEISNVLSCAKVSKKIQHQQSEDTFCLHTYPTPGGLHSAEVYVALLNPEKKTAYITHYNPLDHTLDVICENLASQILWSALCSRGQGGVENASAVIVITSIFERLAVKYGLLSYRLALMEAGLLGHHIVLSATSHNIQSLTWAGFLDDDLNRLLGCDGVTETVTNCVFVGKGE